MRTRVKPLLPLLGAMALLLASLPAAPPAQAATFTVTTTEDADQAPGFTGQCVTTTGSCTLRAAINAARDLAAQSASTNAHLINLGAAGTYLLALGQLTIDGTANGLTLVIANASGGGVAINGNNASRVFNVGPTSAATVYLDRVTIQHGNAGGGAAILNVGTVTLTNSTISGKSVSGGGGGGIFNSGTVTLTNSTVSGNSASSGGGGGIYNDGTVTLQSTIIARSGGGNCFSYVTITSQGDNLSDDGSCGLGANDLAPGTNPLLGALGNYGGFTQTIPLLEGSPAINGVTHNPCPPPTTDQRGVTRTSPCDIGAFEGFIRGRRAERLLTRSHWVQQPRKGDTRPHAKATGGAIRGPLWQRCAS